jgi:hypothetical protein
MEVSVTAAVSNRDAASGRGLLATDTIDLDDWLVARMTHTIAIKLPWFGNW